MRYSLVGFDILAPQCDRELNYNMQVKRSGFLIILLLSAAPFLFSQTVRNGATATDSGAIRSSPAYEEILLRKTELEADMEALAADYTEANPKIIDLRYDINALEKARLRLLRVNPAE